MLTVSGQVRLTKDPELRYTESGTAILTFGIADSTGKDKYERKVFRNCKAFGTVAENIAKYFVKGKPIFIKGESLTDVYEKDGKKVYYDYIKVDQFEFVLTDKTQEEFNDQF